MTDQPPTDEQPSANQPRRLTRSRSDRVFAGVAGGLGRHFDVDPVVFRIAFPVLSLFGGVGAILYLAAVIFVPDEDGAGEAEPLSRTTLIVGGAVLGLLALAVIAGGPWFGPFWLDPFGLFWLLLLAVVAAVAWRRIERRGPQAAGGADILRRLAIVLGLVVLTAIAAVGAAWGTAVGGGEVVAGLVIGLGALLVVTSFYGSAAWLVLPALALAFPAGLVAAADVELEGGMGHEHYRPADVAQLRDGYDLAVGRLELDLRDVDFPPGTTRLSARVGMGELDVVVSEDLCVVTTGNVGLGAIDTFGRDTGGIDVDRHEGGPRRAGAPRLELDADVGIGQLRVVDDIGEIHKRQRDRGPLGRRDDDDGRENDPCREGAA